MGSYVLLSLLVKKYFIPTCKPKLFLMNERKFLLQGYKESAFESTKVPNLKTCVHLIHPYPSQRHRPGLYYFIRDYLFHVKKFSFHFHYNNVELYVCGHSSFGLQLKNGLL